MKPKTPPTTLCLNRFMNGRVRLSCSGLHRPHLARSNVKKIFEEYFPLASANFRRFRLLGN